MANNPVHKLMKFSSAGTKVNFEFVCKTVTQSLNDPDPNGNSSWDKTTCPICLKGKPRGKAKNKG